jgi:hypothetical protein
MDLNGYKCFWVAMLWLTRLSRRVCRLITTVLAPPQQYFSGEFISKCVPAHQPRIICPALSEPQICKGSIYNSAFFEAYLIGERRNFPAYRSINFEVQEKRKRTDK